MVFKGRFFSSKKSSSPSSPEGSNTNSPRSTSSSSPIKSSSSDKKNNKLNNQQPPSFRQIQVKDGTPSSPSKPITARSGAGAVSGDRDVSGGDKVTVSPILASSLGLNRIKTRSGPLPQESFFSFGKESGNAKNGESSSEAAGMMFCVFRMIA
ncbi:protein kinase superfamily protein [Artemisia annua]|uniref:Protein kinase superfamily protein n=1 Tax=Artemisia annua TaxID=35608 RepID=A0A2U1K957_ARTAN|nr:protein kinase superfamily protein [Artemisia annua]